MTIPGDLPIEPRGALLITTDPAGQVANFDQLCILSVDDYQRYKQAYKQISGLLFGSVYNYFTSSKSLLRSTVRAANEAFDAGLIQPNSAPDTFTTWLTSLRSTALSLCSSVVYHQEQMLQRTSSTHGKSSGEYAEVKKIFSNLYDGYAGYRFLCRLRNVMVHDSIEAVAVSAKRTLIGGSRVQTRFHATIDRAFVSQSEMTKVVKAEIVGRRENPDILVLADEITAPLADANTKIEKFLYVNMSTTYRAVAEFDDLFEGKPGLRAICNSPDDGPGPYVPGYTPWSQQVIELARKRL